jgi:hypothetical protein
MDLTDTGPCGQPVGDAIAIMPAGFAAGMAIENTGCNAAAWPQYVAARYSTILPTSAWLIGANTLSSRASAATPQ